MRPSENARISETTSLAAFVVSHSSVDSDRRQRADARLTVLPELPKSNGTVSVGDRQ